MACSQGIRNTVSCNRNENNITMYFDVVEAIFALDMFRERNVYEVWLRDELKRRSLHLLDNLSYCLIRAPENFQAFLAGFEPITFTMPMQCSNQQSNEATQM